MDGDNKRSLIGALVIVGTLLAAIVAAAQIRALSSADRVVGVTLVVLLVAALLAWQNRESLRRTVGALPPRRRALLGSAAALLAIAGGFGLYRLAQPPAPLEIYRPPMPKPKPPDQATPARQPGSPDPRDPYGIPTVGDGSTLATYHKQANSRSILNRLPDGDAVRAYLQTRPYLPIFRNYCRIDPYAGVLALQFVPSGSDVIVNRQATANSVLGRARAHEPALRDSDPEAVTSRRADAECSGKSCTVRFRDGGSAVSIRWNDTAQDVVMAQQGQERNWQDCRCRFSGSFTTCEGVEEPLAERR